MIEQLFSKLGLTANEAAIYLSLAETGKSIAALIAKKVAVPRSTAYTALESLLQRGLVSLEHTSDVTYFVSNPPDAITRMIRKQHDEAEQQFKDKWETATELTELVRPHFQSQHYSVPKLQFFEGTANVEGMLYNFCREWQKSISHHDLTWWGYQDDQLVELYREWLDYYWNSMLPGEEIKLFSNRSPVEKSLKSKVKRRMIKILPKGHSFSSTIWTLGDYVITIVSRQKPHYAIQLQDSVSAANQRMVFKLLWEAY